MFVTRELIKEEVDKLHDKYLEPLYRVIQAFETPTDTISGKSQAINSSSDTSREDWQNFVNQMYGALAEYPIMRDDQGVYEVREKME